MAPSRDQMGQSEPGYIMASLQKPNLNPGNCEPRHCESQPPKPPARHFYKPSRWGKRPHPDDVNWRADTTLSQRQWPGRSSRCENCFKVADFVHSMIDAKNKVPYYQRFYQQAYKAHTRLWMIVRPTAYPWPAERRLANNTTGPPQPLVHGALPCPALGIFRRLVGAALTAKLVLTRL
jgi:hypothetical protein